MNNKITVTVDMDDIYSEEGEEISVNELIEHAIKTEVSSQLRLMAKKSIENEVSIKIDSELKSIAIGELKELIAKKVSEKFISLNVNSRYGSEKNKPVVEFVVDEITRLTGSDLNSKLDKIIQRETGGAIKKLQEQYNSVFASSIINKLYENDFLSKKAVAAIMNKTSE